MPGKEIAPGAVPAREGAEERSIFVAGWDACLQLQDQGRLFRVSQGPADAGRGSMFRQKCAPRSPPPARLATLFSLALLGLPLATGCGDFGDASRQHLRRLAAQLQQVAAGTKTSVTRSRAGRARAAGAQAGLDTRRALHLRHHSGMASALVEASGSARCSSAQRRERCSADRRVERWRAGRLTKSTSTARWRCRARMGPRTRSAARHRRGPAYPFRSAN